MTQDRFDEIVGQLAPIAARKPTLYLCKTAVLAAAGYAYLLIILLFGLVLLAGLAALAIAGHGIVLVVKAGWLVALFAWTILRCLWVKVPVPEGRRITRAEAPQLFAVLDEFRRELGAAPFHEVVANAEFNAAVVQVPRLGIFGWHRNYLLLGLPFLEAMPVDEFKSVLAHEYGHLASGHAAFSNWIYRQRMTWRRIAAEMAAQGQGGWLIAPFFKRFVPYFNAYSFVLARNNEYEADRAAVRLAGAQTAANALLRAEIIGQFLAEKVYPDYYRHALHAPAPAVAFSSHTRERLGQGPAVGDVSRWTIRATTRRTDSTDTHPAFAERVKAMGLMPAFGPMKEPSAAEALLGSALCRELHQLNDRRWQQANGEGWKQRYAAAEKARGRLAELEKNLDWSRPNWEQAWEQASLVEELRSKQDALPLFQQLAEKDPKHAGAAFVVGRLQLALGNPAGAVALEKAMQLDWRFILPACDLLYGDCLERADQAAADRYLRRYREQQDKLALAQAERSRLERSLVCEPHGLDEKVLKPLAEQVWAMKPVSRAWLVRKKVAHFPDEPLFILGIKVPWYHMHMQGYYEELVRRMARDLKLPGRYYVVSLDFGFSWLAGRMKKTPGALIYTRP